MKLATVRVPGGTRAVVDAGHGVRLLPHHDVGAALEAGDIDGQAHDAPAAPPAEQLVFAPLITAPRKVLCVGHNYRAHIAEMGHEAPAFPNVFSKFASALIGSADDIQLDGAAHQWDWEAELAVVVGTTVHRADTARARAAIAGYSVANDISARDWQRRTSQWLLGKTFDSTTPLGPWLVTPDEVGDLSTHDLSCTVDGVEKQRSTLGDLLFDPVELVAYLSQVCRLEPGDVILTGTPGGVGTARHPVESLGDRQVVRTSISGIGTCENRCVTA